MDMAGHDRARAPVRIGFRLGIRNFGPISRGTLSLKPLTILAGPNNSGKSYAAMLACSILSAYGRLASYYTTYGRSEPGFQAAYKSCNQELHAVTEENKNKESFRIPVSLSKKITMHAIQDFGRILETEINRHFGARTRELVRAGKPYAGITTFDSTAFSIKLGDRLSISSDNSNSYRYSVQLSKEEPSIISEKRQSEDSFIINIGGGVAEKFFKHDLAQFLFDAAGRRIRHPRIPTHLHYLPAARSAMLQERRTPPADITQNDGPADGPQVPGQTGIVTDLLDSIAQIPEKHGTFFEIGSKLEAEMLQGNIGVSAHAAKALPEITYASKNYKSELHRTSSAVSEMAPLVLYLKHIVRPGSLLAIEEPEAHLHPRNQLILAKYIVRMVRSGINVLITTHSAVLLEQLSKHMLADRQRAEAGLKSDKTDYLLPEEVSPHLFAKSEGGYGISPIETSREGIPEQYLAMRE